MIAIRKSLMCVAVLTVPILGAFGAAQGAQAAPVAHTDQAASACTTTYVDEDGYVIGEEYTAPGDVDSGYICGSDGTWW
ncbi:hypothetical protein [Rhodococcus sp. NCIMB 12038]|jgi:hypothetical protein|uniref:hypothetical protein n=1 Tax=Rhodococcus sp. NCIMB 12038 TaxID=933800 RepID=UPI000B3D4926|nr:hypothetical protein [Rhodococcus sp. NCIMB 12038]OUS95067.1 hypothetical protein CA951_13395 [Rhodococcus sp. NCIMB 12038]